MKLKKIIEKNNSIKVNFIMNTLLSIASVIFPLITFPYVSRVLSPSGLGKVSYATSIIAYFIMFSNLGIPTYGIRIVAQKKEDKNELSKNVHEIFIINSFTCLTSYLIFASMIIFVKPLHNYRDVLLILSISIFFNMIGMEWLYKGLEKYTYITKRSIIFKIIAIIFIFVLVKNSYDYKIYGCLSIFANVGSNICNFINTKKYIITKKYSSYSLRKHLKPILIFFAMSIATQIYTNLDSVMIGFLNGDMEVAFYNAAVKIKCVLFSIVTSLSVVLLPRVSYYIEKNNKEQFINVSKKAIEFTIYLALPLSIYFIIFARPSIVLLSGKKYLNAVTPMMIIMPTVLLIGLSNVTGIQMMVPLGLEKRVLISEILGAVVDTIINWILIPKYGSMGAAIGTLVAEFTVLLVQLLSLWNYIKDIIFGINWIKYLIITFITTFIGILLYKIFFNNYILQLFMSFIFCGIIYFILSIFLKINIAMDIYGMINKWLKNIKIK